MARCRSCEARIVWAVTPAGRRIPLDPDPVEGGNVLLAPAIASPSGAVARVLTNDERAAHVGPLHVSHFATCPKAKAHRR